MPRRGFSLLLFSFSFFVFVVRLPACKYLPPAHGGLGKGTKKRLYESCTVLLINTCLEMLL